MTQYQEIESVCDYLQEVDGSSCPTEGFPTRSIHPRVGPNEIPGDAWDIVIQFGGQPVPLDYVPEGLSKRPSIHTIHSLIDSRNDRCPLRGVPFALFRRLGFAFWDELRLAALELEDARHTDQRIYKKGPLYYWYEWLSLLNEEDIAAEEARSAAVQSDII